MKKLLMTGIVLFGCVFLLTGCFGGTETLECTNTQETSGVTIDTEQTLVIKNKKLQTRNVLQTSTLDSTVSDYLDYYIETIESESTGYGGLKDLTGVTYSSETKDNQFIVKIEIDYTKVKESEYSNLNTTLKEFFTDQDQLISADKTKENFESSGYECKLK